MAEIVRECAPLLKSEKFTKRRFAFNRTLPDGLVHIVHFWMAPFEPSAWTEVPGLRERRYGSFRLDFGVWALEMARNGSPRSSWINEYNCQLRRTIGQLLYPESGGDFWWSLSADGIAAEARRQIIEYGLPWLSGFASKDSILEAFESDGPLGIGMHPAAALDIAELYSGLDRGDDARRILEAYVRGLTAGGHADYVARYLVERGQGDLVPLIPSGGKDT